MRSDDLLMEEVAARIAEQEAATAHLVEESTRDLTGKRSRARDDEDDERGK